MKVKLATLVVALVAAALVVVGVVVAAPGKGAEFQHRCQTTAVEYARQCIPTPLGGTGLQITDNRGDLGLLGTPFKITDYLGNPMLYDSMSGLYSGGDGNPKDGGRICVTDRIWRISACLTVTGDLILTETNPDGSQGFTGILTPRKIRFLDCLETDSLAACQRKLAGSQVVTTAIRQPCDALAWYYGDSPYLIFKDEPPGRTPFLEGKIRFVSDPACPLHTGLVSAVIQRKVRQGLHYKWIVVPGTEDHIDFPGDFAPTFKLHLGPRVCLYSGRYRIHLYIFALNLPKSVLDYLPGGNGKWIRCPKLPIGMA